MKNRIKKIAMVVLAIVVVVILWITVIGAVRLMPFSQNKISEVSIRKGNTGELIELTEEEVTLLLETCEPVRCKNIFLLPRGGWDYSIYIQGGEADRDIVFRNEFLCKINGIDYRINVNEGEAIFKLIESFYECRGESEIFGRE